jgi:hypothetical protein
MEYARASDKTVGYDSMTAIATCSVTCGTCIGCTLDEDNFPLKYGIKNRLPSNEKGL